MILLSGDHGERQTLALRLLEEAVAPTLVLVGTSDGGVEKDLCSAPKSFEVVCVRLNPDSTRNEARATAELAEQRGWRSLVVVTSTPHATRAHMLFSRCFDGSVATLGAWPPYGRAEVGRQVVREWFATAKALMSGRC